MSLEWKIKPPLPSKLTDRDVRLTGLHLSGKRIALLITGSIAAYRMPDLVRNFRREGADVVVFSTNEGLRYVAKEALEWCSQNIVIDHFTAEAEHLSDIVPFDVFIVAPATYNILNKAAHGIADCIVSSTIAGALGRMERFGVPLLFAPAMHGSMHNKILTSSMETLREMGACLIPPKQANGKNNLASLELILAATIRSLSKSSLYGKSLLITGGPTPVPLDNIRSITSYFTGTLSINLAREAWLRGASVELILGKGSRPSPDYINTKIAATFDEYARILKKSLSQQFFDWGIFTAAVADFQPEKVYKGKLSSRIKQLDLKLMPTPKMVEEVRKKYPQLKTVTFKYEENVSHEELMKTAKKPFSKKGGPQIVVANRGEEFKSDGTQVAWLIHPKKEPEKHVGKEDIAKAILKHIESNS